MENWTIIIPAPREGVIFALEVFDSEGEANARFKELKELKVTAYKVLMKEVKREIMA
jgi:hypothetical protein